MNDIEKLNKVADNPTTYSVFVNLHNGLISWDGELRWAKQLEVDNFIFEDTLTFVHCCASGVALKSIINGVTFNMFHTEFTDLINKIGDVRQFSGKFTFCKRSSSYGIRVVV